MDEQGRHLRRATIQQVPRYPKVGLLHQGSRWCATSGSTTDFRQWILSLAREFPGDLLSLQWVPDLVGVSRAAVHRRAQTGGLTLLTFFISSPERRTVLGKMRKRDNRRRYDFARLSECLAWRQELIARARKTHDVNEPSGSPERPNMFKDQASTWGTKKDEGPTKRRTRPRRRELE